MSKIYSISQEQLQKWVNDLDYYKVSEVIDEINSFISKSTSSNNNWTNYIAHNSVLCISKNYTHFPQQVVQVTDIDIKNRTADVVLTEEDHSTDILKNHLLTISFDYLEPLSNYYDTTSEKQTSGFYMIIPYSGPKEIIPHEIKNNVSYLSSYNKYVCSIEHFYKQQGFTYAKCTILTNCRNYNKEIYVPTSCLLPISFDKALSLNIKNP